MQRNRDSLLIDFRNKVYGEPQRKLKADEAETRIVMCVGYGNYKWGHPTLQDIVAKDLAKKSKDDAENLN